MIISLYYKFLFVIVVFLSTQTLALSNSSFIKIVLENKALFETEAINLEIKKLEFYGDYEYYNNWYNGVDGYLSLAKEINDKDTNYTYTHKEQGYKRYLSYNATKNFFTNGSELNISLDKYLKNAEEEKYKNQLYSADVDAYESLLSFNVNWKLPLMYNASGILEQTNYDIAKLEFKDATLVFRDFQENKVADYLKIYYECAFIIEKINFLEEYINQLKQVDNYIKQAKFDEKQIKYITLALAKASIKLEKLISEELELKKDLTDILTKYEIDNIQTDLYVLNKIPYVNNIETNSIVLKRIKIDQLQNNRKILYYENKSKPILDFVLDLDREIKKGNYSSYSKLHSNDLEVSLNFKNSLGKSYVEVKTLLKKYNLNTRKLEIKYNSNLQSLQEQQNLLESELQTILSKIKDIDAQLNQTVLLDISKISQANLKESIINVTKTLDLKYDYLDEHFSYKSNLIDLKVMLALLLTDSF